MRVLRVTTPPRSYTVHVEAGARVEFAALLRRLAGLRSVVVIADDTVAELHGAKLGASLPAPPTIVRVPPGEASKSLAQAERLYDALGDARVGRRDLVVAFGGGVTGDLAGFVAGTWLRGVRWIQIPTTLEAAIDASVGGKTGLNHRAGKNLIGVFHQPEAVIIDTDFLTTLPQRDYVAGLAESVKHAAVRDAAFLAWHEQNAGEILARRPDVLEELIARNVQIKAAVVAADEREEDLRRILNYGHTIGHAIEHLLGYELRHGECVALGMLAENELACLRGELGRAVAERIRTLLAQLGLPVRLPRRLDPRALLTVCALDKKVAGGAIHFALLRDVAQPVVVADVADEQARQAIAAIQPVVADPPDA